MSVLFSWKHCFALLYDKEFAFPLLLLSNFSVLESEWRSGRESNPQVPRDTVIYKITGLASCPTAPHSNFFRDLTAKVLACYIL